MWTIASQECSHRKGLVGDFKLAKVLSRTIHRCAKCFQQHHNLALFSLAELEVYFLPLKIYLLCYIIFRVYPHMHNIPPPSLVQIAIACVIHNFEVRRLLIYPLVQFPPEGFIQFAVPSVHHSPPNSPQKKESWKG